MVHHNYHNGHNNKSNSNLQHDNNNINNGCWFNSSTPTITTTGGVYKFYGFLIDAKRFDSPPESDQQQGERVKEGDVILSIKC